MTESRLTPRLVAELGVLGCITALGALLRIIPAILAGFPMNDGGLFFSMMRAIQAGGPGLPDVVSYNGESLPFAYPPLALYLGALLSGEGSPIGALRWLPIIASVLTIPAAYAVLRQLLPTPWMAAVATTAFAVMPRSYNWMIGGGGITRSLGFLLAVTAIAMVIRSARTRSLGWALASGVTLGLSTLSHPQAPIFAVASVVALLITNATGIRRAWVSVAIVGATAAVVVLPWLVLVVSRHGLTTLSDAAATGGNVADAALMFFTFRFSDGQFEVLGIIGAFGLFVCLLNRVWLWPLWTALTLLVGSRAGLSYATLPVSGAIAYAVADGLRLLRTNAPTTVNDLRSRPRLTVMLGFVLLLAVADSLAAMRLPLSPLVAVSPAQRAAMEWVAKNTPTDARFLVVSGKPWELDSVAEWFPVIARRRSTATVQGTEWQGAGRFSHLVQERFALLSCAAFSDRDCADSWQENVEHIDYVFAVDGDAAAAEGHPCCLQIARRAAQNGGEVVLDGDGLLIVRLATPADSARN